MSPKFTNRSAYLFGRDPDIAFLLNRATRRGITVVTGKAQMGKSWLLTETARRLVISEQKHLVGFTESYGETSDLMLRAVVDLYTAWLCDSTWSQQANVIWNQHKKEFISNAGIVVGTLLDKVSKLGAAKPVEVVGGLVKQTLEGLAKVNSDLLSGRVELPQLQFEQARDLLALVHGITNLPLALFLDQWEKSPAVEFEVKLLDAFLRHIDDY